MSPSKAVGFLVLISGVGYRTQGRDDGLGFRDWGLGFIGF